MDAMEYDLTSEEIAKERRLTANVERFIDHGTLDDAVRRAIAHDPASNK